VGHPFLLFLVSGKPLFRRVCLPFLKTPACYVDAVNALLKAKKMTPHSKPRNIYIVGAQCTGKTTLIKALQDHFKNTEDFGGYPFSRPKTITEVARTVLKQHNFTADDITSSPARSLALQQLILQAQVATERDISAQNDWFISDRSGADPIVYARKYVNEDAASDLIRSAGWLELRDRMRNSVVVVCEAGADWLTDDGVRLMPKDRAEWIRFHQLFCSCLDDWGLNYEVLPYEVSNLHERVTFVLERWEQAYKKG
jgi:predicted ATPase